MKPYQLTIAYEIVEFVQKQDELGRKTINQALRALKDFPHNGKDLTERGLSGREHFVNLRGKFAIKYWIDEWEHEVKVIDIRLRDRR